MLTRLLFVNCLVFLSSHFVHAEKAVTSTLGKTAPQWLDLPGTDSKLHSSIDYKNVKATLVVFLCNHCPCAKGYEARFNDFADKYRDLGVQVVAFNADTAETMDAMKQRAAESKFKFDYLRDESQKVAAAFGAKTTPHVFLLDANRNIVFSGAFDDDMRGKNITKYYIEDAVKNVLADQAVSVMESRLCGCPINYSN